MSLLTDYNNTLHGAADRNGNTISVRRNYAKNGTTFQDYSTNAINGVAVGAPGSTSGAGRDGTDLHSYGGAADGHDLGTALAAQVCTDLEDGVGVTVAWDMRHSNSADKDAIFDGTDGSVRNGIRIGVNYNTLYNYGAHKISVNMVDNAGNSRRYHWDVSATQIATDGLTHQYAVLLTKTAGLLYIDGTLVAITSTGGATLGTMSTSATHKYGFACTGFGASISMGEPFSGSAGNLLVCRGLLTEAQVRARLAIHVSESRSTDGTPLTRVWRADTNVFDGATSPPAALDDDVTAWSSTDGQITMAEDSASDPGSGAPQLIPTYCPVGPFNTAPCIIGDNLFAKNAFDDVAYAAILGGHRRQTFKSEPFPGLVFNGSNVSLWVACRIPCGNPLGNTFQMIAGLYDGGVLKVGIAFQSGRLVLIGPSSVVRDASTSDVRDCPNGPSLVYAEVTVAPNGVCSIRVNGQSGATTSTLSVGVTEIDEIHFFGTQSGNGGDCAHVFCYEIGIAETVSTSAEQAARAARIFTQYGASGETLTPSKRMLFSGDSLVTQYSTYGRAVPMLLPVACVRDTDWIWQDQPGCAMDSTSNDFASHNMNATAKKSTTATWHGILIALGGNDMLAGNTASQVNTELGTALASISGFDWIAAVGVHDYDGSAVAFQNAYQDLINARVSDGTLNAAIRLRTSVGLLVADGIHGAGIAFQTQFAEDIWNNSAGGSGGGLSGVLGGSISKRLFIINND